VIVVGNFVARNSMLESEEVHGNELTCEIVVRMFLYEIGVIVIYISIYAPLDERLSSEILKFTQKL
jgi:hypothetical protein